MRKIDISVGKGETLGIVGESGSGKSVTSFAVMRILDRAGHVAGGTVTFSGIDLLAASDRDMADMRGREMSMIFQNPRAALNPIRKVGHQIEDVLLRHVQAVRSNVREKAIDILKQVRIARPEERYHAYPFELSGGMCQRIVIAIALACRPQLLIADEPTTGLDVTTQKAVMELVVELTRERGMSTVLITHDLGLAAAYCDRVVVMQKGEVIETAPSATIFKAPAHAYTRKLMRATPRPGATLRDLLEEERPASPPSTVQQDGRPLLKIDNLVKEYPRQGVTKTMAQLFGRKAPSRRRAALPRRRRDQLRDHARAERRPCRRIRLRQVDDVDDGDAPSRPNLGFDHSRRRGYRRHSRRAASPNCRRASASRWCSRTRPTV